MLYAIETASPKQFTATWTMLLETSNLVSRVGATRTRLKR